MDKENLNAMRIHIPKQYKIDPNKINTQEDLLSLLKAIILNIDITINENVQGFDKIKKYLREVK